MINIDLFNYYPYCISFIYCGTTKVTLQYYYISIGGFLLRIEEVFVKN